MKASAFPAILLAGPPHSGKSVLAFLLTQRLRDRNVAHYLLRAVPDGEGDWFHAGPSEQMQTLRIQHKRGYTSEFIHHMLKALENRWVPMLVDIGGRPQGEQIALMMNCTHVILLYRDGRERVEWQGLIKAARLQTLAELHSVQYSKERIEQLRPVLRGTISGLERERDRRRVGPTFAALLEYVAEICHYKVSELEHFHTQGAPYSLVSERDLARLLGIPLENGLHWEPGRWQGIRKLIQPGKAYSLYGRGPVWLAAMLAIYALPAPFAIFDIRFGWIVVPAVCFRNHVHLRTEINGNWYTVQLPANGILHPGTLYIPPILGDCGIILSGKLPRWTFAALARHFSTERPWVGIDIPAQERIVIVASNCSHISVGDILTRSAVQLAAVPN
jgi:CRISPR-associated protein Csx3